MHQPPRPHDEPVVTRIMWRHIVVNGVVMAAATLLVLDMSLPGGLVQGNGSLRFAQTMAFTTLMLAQLFIVLTARSEEQSAFVALFSNRWLWGAIGLSLALQLVVLYVPAMQQAFGTTGLSAAEWGRCALAARAVLWLSELSKLVARLRHAR